MAISGSNTIDYPFGDIATETLTATGTQAISITEQVTYIDGVTTKATGNRTITLTFATNVRAGARIFVASKTNTTETTIFSTGCTAPTITGEAQKTYCVELFYNGTTAYAAGTAVKVD